MFSFDDLDDLGSFAARKRYCESNLERIKGGTGRDVYDMGDGRVLKLAKSAKGRAQNEVENDFGVAHMYDRLNMPLDADTENGNWIIAKKLEPVTKKQFQDMTGVTMREFERFCSKMTQYTMNPNKFRGHPLDGIDEPEGGLMHEISEISINTDLLANEWQRMSSWGYDRENDKLKITDWGLNKPTYEQHFRVQNTPQMGM